MKILNWIDWIAFSFFFWLYKKNVSKSKHPLAYPVLISMEFEKEVWWQNYHQRGQSISYQIDNKIKKTTRKLNRVKSRMRRFDKYFKNHPDFSSRYFRFVIHLRRKEREKEFEGYLKEIEEIKKQSN